MNLSTHKKSEVDLRVAQELKNNQDFIYQTNQSLQVLRQGIVSLSLENEKNLAKSGSQINNVSIAFENLQEEVLKKLKDIDQRLGDMQSKMIDFSNNFSYLKDRIELEYLKRSEFISALVPEARKIDLIEKDLFIKNERINILINNLNELLNVKIDSTKEYLINKIPDIDPIKKKLNDYLRIFKVDFDGLSREINVLKKSVDYGQKKFENIYTLIERLKAGNQ